MPALANDIIPPMTTLVIKAIMAELINLIILFLFTWVNYLPILKLPLKSFTNSSNCMVGFEGIYCLEILHNSRLTLYGYFL